MTLLDLLQLIKRFKKLVVIVPVVCALMVFAIMLVMPKDYQAVATITASNEVAAAGGIATTVASEVSHNGVTVKAATNANAKQITLTAEGHDIQSTQEAANSAAQSAANRAQESFSAQTFTVSTATTVKDISQSPFKIALIILLVSLCIVIVCIIGWDAVRCPVKNKTDLEEISQIPIIGEVPSQDHGERLFANVRFIAKGRLNTICIVPLSDLTSSYPVAEEIYEAASLLGIDVEIFKADPHAEYLYTDTELADFNIIDCAPLSQGVGAAYLGRNADVVVLAVREWKDSTIEIKNVLSEFNIAGIDLAGVVLLSEKGSGENAKNRRQLQLSSLNKKSHYFGSHDK